MASQICFPMRQGLLNTFERAENRLGFIQNIFFIMLLTQKLPGSFYNFQFNMMVYIFFNDLEVTS